MRRRSTSPDVTIWAHATPIRSRLVHQLTGLAGTLGFPTVSERALDLEQMVAAIGAAGVAADAMSTALQQVRAAFAEDLSRPAPDWARQTAVSDGATILVVEDDPAQRAIMCAALKSAGYRTTWTGDGAAAFDAARAERRR